MSKIHIIYSNPYILALVVCIAVVAWMFSGYWVPAEEPHLLQAPPIDSSRPRMVRVRTSVAEAREDIAHLFGHTQASRQVTLRAEVEGRVAELAVERGATVTTGAIVVRLAPDDRKARLIEARALLVQYQAELNATSTLARKGSRAELDVSAAQARLEAARTMTTRMEIELERTTLHAPFAGVVETRLVELGSYLQVGDPLVTIVDLNPLLIVGYIAEGEVSRVVLGKSAQARLVDGRMINGKITYVAAVADPVTRTFRVELEVPNPRSTVVEGLTAELLIPLGTINAHQINPAILSLADDGRLGVKTVTTDNMVEFSPVRIVATSPEAMWVDGLPPRVTLIVVGQDFVVPGQQVNTVQVAP